MKFVREKLGIFYRAAGKLRALTPATLLTDVKVYEDAELKALLDQDSCQTPQELARTLGVTKQAIFHGKKLLCIWWNQLGVVYYELLSPNETITGSVYRIQLMRFSRELKEKRAHYYF